MRTKLLFWMAPSHRIVMVWRSISQLMLFMRESLGYIINCLMLFISIGISCHCYFVWNCHKKSTSVLQLRMFKEKTRCSHLITPTNSMSLGTSWNPYIPKAVKLYLHTRKKQLALLTSNNEIKLVMPIISVNNIY